jgi:hypothetical protein
LIEIKDQPAGVDHNLVASNTSRRSAMLRLNPEGSIMTKLPYLRTMFASCMLFQVIFVLCAALWLVFPDLKGHAFLPAIFPNFTLLTLGSFIYGLIASALYGWIAAIIFVFFYNLWPAFDRWVFGGILSSGRQA